MLKRFQWLLLGVLVLAINCQGPPLSLPVQPGIDAAVEANENLAALEQLARDYSLKIVIHPEFPVYDSHAAITGETAKREDIESYIPLLVQEWELYPVELVKKSNLRHIILCQNLAYGGQLRTGIPDFRHDDLYFDVARGRHDKRYVRHCIHHEFFHIIDWKDDGHLYDDVRWSSLNPTGFRYGKGGKNMQDDAMAGVMTEKYPGFLNFYSTSGVEEDKAEVFATMVIMPKYMLERIAKDAVLKAKTVRMKELLHEFCPQIDEAFWEKVNGLERK